jgi:hypothetical protein
VGFLLPTLAISQAGLEEGSPIMQLLKEPTRERQLDSCCQPGWAGGREPYHAAAERTHQSVAAGQLLSARLGWRKGALPCSCLKKSPECGSWTAAISQTGLEEGNPTMQLLKELTRVWQLDSCYHWQGWKKPGFF